MVDIADWPNNLRCELCQSKLVELELSVHYSYNCLNAHNFEFGSKSYHYEVKTYKRKNSMVAERYSFADKYGKIVDNIAYMGIRSNAVIDYYNDSTRWGGKMPLPDGEDCEFVVCNHYIIDGINVNQSVVNIIYIDFKRKPTKSVKFDFRFDLKNLTLEKLRAYLILA